jgi:hypothetical protein
MYDEVLKVIERWQSDERLTSLSEDQVKQAIILPILRGLGWNPNDPYEVWPEYHVGVDYALSIDNTPKIFIEAKNGAEQLGDHEKQLLDYTKFHQLLDRAKRGVKIAILTNGIAWWFYLPFYNGQLRKFAKFATVELNKQDKGEIVQKLATFLGKENMRFGEAVQSAKDLCEKHQIPVILSSELPDVPPYICEIVERFVGIKIEWGNKRIAAKYRDKNGNVKDWNVFTLVLDCKDEWILILNYSDQKDFPGTKPHEGRGRYPSLLASDKNAPPFLKKHLKICKDKGWFD